MPPLLLAKIVDPQSRYSNARRCPMPATARAKEQPPKGETKNLPLEEQIRRRAYELYVVHGSQFGSELDDWLRAEEEIRSTLEQEQQAKYA
jgi:hypothetical protein